MVIGCLRLNDVSVICHVVNQRRTSYKIGEVSCTECTGQPRQGNDIELILTVEMETRKPAEGYFGSEVNFRQSHSRWQLTAKNGAVKWHQRVWRIQKQQQVGLLLVSGITMLSTSTLLVASALGGDDVTSHWSSVSVAAVAARSSASEDDVRTRTAYWSRAVSLAQCSQDNYSTPGWLTDHFYFLTLGHSGA